MDKRDQKKYTNDTTVKKKQNKRKEKKTKTKVMIGKEKRNFRLCAHTNTIFSGYIHKQNCIKLYLVLFKRFQS